MSRNTVQTLRVTSGSSPICNANRNANDLIGSGSNYCPHTKHSHANKNVHANQPHGMCRAEFALTYKYKNARAVRLSKPKDKYICVHHSQYEAIRST